MNHPSDKFYSEEHVLNELEYYLKEIKYNKNILKEISGSILPKFIEDDNKKLRKLFRKIYIIKKRQEQKKIMHYFNKWIINMYNLENKDNKSRNNEKSITIKNKQEKELSIKEKEKENKSKSNSLIKKEKSYNNFLLNGKKINKAINLKLASTTKNTTKNKINKVNSFSYKNYKNKKTNTNSLISKKTCQNITTNSKLSPIQIKKFNPKKNNNNKKIKIKTQIENTKNNSCSFAKQVHVILSEMKTKNKKVKTPNKNKNLVKNFMNNLVISNKIKEEKMKILKLTKEEKINSLYTFSPKLINNKKNEKYFKNMINKFHTNNTNDLSNNNIPINEENIHSNNCNINKHNNYNLYVVSEKNKKNKKINFFSRLNEYAQRKIINLEKIKNDILMDQLINEKNNKNNTSNYKYNIIDDHLLNASTSYYDNKKRKIKKLEEEIDEERGITFEPKLNHQYNNKIKNNFVNLKEILLNKKNEKIFDYLSSKDKECTFHPKINEINRINDINNVSERLLSYLEKYNEQLNKLKDKNPKFTFKPKISKNTDIILNNRKINNSKKEELKLNFSSGDLNKEYKEEKYSLKISHNQKKFENNKENANFTPDFNYSPKENLQKIDFNEFNNDLINENSNFEEEFYFNRKYRNYFINNDNKKNKKQFNNNKNNLMSFDYYENLI